MAPGLPVVITSGWVTEDLQAHAREAGVRAVLAKEFAFERMAVVVREVLAAAATMPSA